MKILTRHILKEFFRPFLFSIALLSVIILVSELFEKLDTFLSSHTSVTVIVKYLAAYLPVSIFEIFPVATLLGILFSISDFVQKGEYTAVRSAGINPMRIFSPLLLAGLLISTSVVILNDRILPKSIENVNRIYYREVRNIPDYNMRSWDNLVLNGRDNRMFFINHYNYKKQLLSRIVINEYTKGRKTRQIDAREMSWDGNTGLWLLRDGIIREFSDEGDDITHETPFKEHSLKLPERPADFIPREKDAEEMNYRELKGLIAKLKQMGLPWKKELVDLHMKLAYPMANLIVMLIGLPFALLIRKSGKMLNFAFALMIAFSYWTAISFGRSMGETGAFPPILGAWFANIIFGTAGIITLLKIRK